jgi:hypothetical protein
MNEWIATRRAQALCEVTYRASQQSQQYPSEKKAYQTMWDNWYIGGKSDEIPDWAKLNTTVYFKGQEGDYKDKVGRGKVVGSFKYPTTNSQATGVVVANPKLVGYFLFRRKIKTYKVKHKGKYIRMLIVNNKDLVSEKMTASCPDHLPESITNTDLGVAPGRRRDIYPMIWEFVPSPPPSLTVVDDDDDVDNGDGVDTDVDDSGATTNDTFA